MAIAFAITVSLIIFFNDILTGSCVLSCSIKLAVLFDFDYFPMVFLL